MGEQEYMTWFRLRLKVAHFLRIQVICIALAFVGGILAFVFLRNSTRGLLRHVWLVFLVMFVGEIIETIIALWRRGRRSPKRQKNGEDGE